MVDVIVSVTILTFNKKNNKDTNGLNLSIPYNIRIQPTKPTERQFHVGTIPRRNQNVRRHFCAQRLCILQRSDYAHLAKYRPLLLARDYVRRERSIHLRATRSPRQRADASRTRSWPFAPRFPGRRQLVHPVHRRRGR